MKALTVTSTAFEQGDWIPQKYTARGEDLSPPFHLENLAENAASIVVTLDDASHPIFPNYNHWVIWNLPVNHSIPQGIPAGAQPKGLGQAMQGIGYGRHRYKGPKPPLRTVHTYTFTVFVLDCLLDLPPNSRKDAVLRQMEGHILQQATLSGKFQSHRE